MTVFFYSGFILLPRSVDLLVQCHGESHTKQLGKQKVMLGMNSAVR